ncbi:MAG TPA: formyltetrahydrofolate deformylase, partial [Solirubrobacterales bacterium]|nr:formyltetrahydrofolate deformylase [Solirubrobacterales bacterium]
ILTSHQYSRGNGSGRFFLRMEFACPPGLEVATLEERFEQDVAKPFEMDWQIWQTGRAKRVAVLVSKYDHCLQELLWRWRRAELGGAELALVASNHPDLKEPVEAFGLPYHYIPVEKGKKPEAEAAQLELLAGSCDLVVLARYMQILSGEFLQGVGVPVINIHHSFLPAFAGAGPYERAKERGVKLVGATAHYVTEELDAGPIVEQDVIRVDHADSARELERLGADIERAVLARAVQWHCEDRILLDGNTTVVF